MKEEVGYQWDRRTRGGEERRRREGRRGQGGGTFGCLLHRSPAARVVVTHKPAVIVLLHALSDKCSDSVAEVAVHTLHPSGKWRERDKG
jgi:hypothetical protein